MGSLMTTTKDAGSGQFIWGENDMIAGYWGKPTTNMDANGILFGDFSQVLLGFWGVLDITVDPYTEGDKANIILRAYQDFDFALRYDQALCVDA